MEAKDYLGNLIKENDRVVFTELSYRNFEKGTITKITDKMLFIEWEKPNYDKKIVKQRHEQVIKI